MFCTLSVNKTALRLGKLLGN